MVLTVEAQRLRLTRGLLVAVLVSLGLAAAPATVRAAGPERPPVKAPSRLGPEPAPVARATAPSTPSTSTGNDVDDHICHRSDDVASGPRFDDVRPAAAAAGHQRTAEATRTPACPTQGHAPREDRGQSSRTHDPAGDRARARGCSGGHERVESPSFPRRARPPLPRPGRRGLPRHVGARDPGPELALHDERAGAEQLAVAPGGELAAARPDVPAVGARPQLELPASVLPGAR